jgi:hypothetical protein
VFAAQCRRTSEPIIPWPSGLEPQVKRSTLGRHRQQGALQCEREFAKPGIAHYFKLKEKFSGYSENSRVNGHTNNFLLNCTLSLLVFVRLLCKK